MMTLQPLFYRAGHEQAGVAWEIVGLRKKSDVRVMRVRLLRLQSKVQGDANVTISGSDCRVIAVSK